MTMQRIAVVLVASIIALGMLSTPAVAQHALGDLGKPPDYDKTIKRFRQAIPNFDAWEQALPTSFDWRTYGVVTEAKDQGSCGSCWAFASVGVLESKILMMGRSLYDLSEQQQVSCNGAMLECYGGTAAALQFWYTQGPMLESCTGYPSSGGSEPSCSHLASCGQLPYHTMNYYTVDTSDINEIKASLHNDGPAFFRFNVHRDFYNPDSPYDGFWQTAGSGAVYTNTTLNYVGGHAVLIIGWDDSKGAWLLKNSWGATGGPNHDGTFWMAYTGHTYNLQFGMANVEANYAAPDVLHRDGAFWSSSTAWNTATPPYYPGTAYAVRLKTNADGSSTILHTDGAIWNSTTGWNTATPPYYPGTAYAKDLEEIVLIDQGFDTYCGIDCPTFPPPGWHVVHGEEGCQWMTNTYFGPPNYTGGSGTCADADQVGCGALIPLDLELWTPAFSLADAASATLTFRASYNDMSGDTDYAAVDITTNGGSSWLNLLYWTTDHPGELVTLDLTPYCGNSTVMIRFHYYTTSAHEPNPPLSEYGFFEVDDVRVVVPNKAILHKDGALWNSVTGWTMTTPPYYPGTDYARDLEYRSNGSYIILHKDGAVYDSASTWNTATPPFYPGIDYARAVQFKTGETNYVILHKDGALWSTDGGWVLTTPPYYPGSDYARGLKQVGSKYIILHKDGAIYDSMDGWYMGTPPYYPGTEYAVDLEVR